MKRKIIEIDENKCNGCGLCIPECKEGAIQIIEGKARLVSDLFCDGLGACIGYCPEDAITIVEKEAEPYNERKVIDKLLSSPKSVLNAHLNHLKEHNDIENYNIAVDYLKSKGIDMHLPESKQSSVGCSTGKCPGTMTLDWADENKELDYNSEIVESQLKQWPIQLHLVNPMAPYFKNSELAVLSTCSPIAFGNIQQEYIKGKSIVVACPKLDYTAPYSQKLADIFKLNNIKKVTVLLMEVPCCKGLSKIVTDARNTSGVNNLKVEEHTITLDGKLKSINFI